MIHDFGLLTVTAASIGFIHTLLGPDHYLPFAAIAAARRWSTLRTASVTVLCGIAHVLGSVLLGVVGLAVGLTLDRLSWLETVRGDVAAWLLTGFGLAYAIWGLRHAWRSRPHAHEHVHVGGTRHVHLHDHHAGHLHLHESVALSITPWALFMIFAFGPCEPLIPVLMYPAAHASWWGVAIVGAVFGIVTIATMLAAVLLTRRGLDLVNVSAIGRYSHACAGATLLICGFGILALGL